MKNFTKASKSIAVGLVAVGLSACSTANHKSVEAWQGKVWRGLVAKTLIDTTEYRPTDKDWIESTNYVALRDYGMRLTRVHFASGWNSVLANAAVPDNIQFSDLSKGTLVDVLAETGPATDYSKRRFTRVLRVVCAASDTACLDREKAAKRIGAVMDSDLGASYLADGLTYDKRMTKADVEKYE